MHEVVAGLLPVTFDRSPNRETITRAQITRIAWRAVATPTPRPTPMPTVSPTETLQKRTPVLLAAVEGRAGASHAPRAVRPARVTRALQGPATPVWDVPGSMISTGRVVAATGNAASAGNGAGTGAGTAGTGDAAASGSVPCGFVTFSDPHGSHYDPRTRGFYVDIRMSVHFADGSSQSLILDYPWYYASEAANPWSDQNLRDPDFPTRFQAPPAGKTENEPAVVRYVMDHSTADGLTLLKDCPTPAPPPAERLRP